MMADLGFEAVALTPDVPHLDPMRCRPSEVERTAALLQGLGMTVVLETGGRFLLDPLRKHRPNLLENDPAARRRRLNLLLRCLELAADLGAEALSFWSGTRPEGVSPEVALARLREGFEVLGGRAREAGVPLALEPEPGMCIETVEEALAFRGSLGNPEILGICVDIGHLYVTGEGSPSEVLPKVRGICRQVHLEDVPSGTHLHLPPGEGVVDFAEAFRALEGIDWDGPVCFELSRHSAEAPDQLRRARELFLRFRKA